MLNGLSMKSFARQRSKAHWLSLPLGLAIFIFSPFGCKRQPVSDSSAQSDASGVAGDFEELDLLVAWGVGDNSQKATVFTVSDGTGSPLLVQPGNISFLERSGNLNTAQEGTDFTPLGHLPGKIYPTLDLDLTFTNVSEKRYQWCHTPSGLPFGSKGKVRCYRRDSDRGRFVTGCLASKSTLRVGKDLLQCSSISTNGRGDYTFNFGVAMDPGITIAALPLFRDFQEFCASTGAASTLKLHSTEPRQCLCSAANGGPPKLYDLWQVSNYYLQANVQDIRTDFLGFCSQQKDYPVIISEKNSSTPEQAAAFQENVAICKQLISRGLAQSGASDDACSCLPSVTTGAQGSAAPQNPAQPITVPLRDTSVEQFIDRCFALASLSPKDVCSRFGMSYQDPVDPAVPTAAKCIKVDPMHGNTVEECVFLTNNPKAEFVKKCLKLGTAPAQQQPSPAPPVPGTQQPVGDGASPVAPVPAQGAR